MPSTKRIRNRKRNPGESSSRGSPAQVIAGNIDLLSEILLFLPGKSLLRFKSVSKQWLSLISDPQFIRRKSLKSKPISLLVLNVDGCCRLRYDVVPLHGRAPLTTLTFAEPPHQSMAIFSSCKGLLLCGDSLASCSQETEYYIYNPTTRQFRSLPPPPPAQAGHKMRVTGFCLALDPHKSHSYRVACTQSLWPSSHLFQLLVYSSETGRWRVSGAPLPLLPKANFHHAVYCHGAIHWMGTGASQCFDLDKELAREIPLHSAVPVNLIAYFGESGGHLHLVARFNCSTTQFPIYEMERDCSGWFVKFQVDLLFPHSHVSSELFYLVRGEKEEDSFLVMLISDKVIRFNLGNRTQEVMYSTNSRRKLIQCNFSKQTHEVIVKSASKGISSCGWHHVHEYIESLSSV